MARNTVKTKPAVKLNFYIPCKNFSNAFLTFHFWLKSGTKVYSGKGKSQFIVYVGTLV